jgi:hypothetical protein
VRLQKELASDGFAVSLGTVKRVRRELGLVCVQHKKRFHVTTMSFCGCVPKMSVCVNN